MSADGNEGDWFDQAFEGQATMVILRGFDPQRTVDLCIRAWDLGITQVEVPVQSPEAMSSLRAAISVARERGASLGAGTVTSLPQLHEVAAAGATFTVAPGLDEDIVKWSKDHGLPHLPGVCTPSEVQRALRLGATWMKVFPAHVLGTAWFRALRAPFPEVKMVATGGMTVETVPAYLDAGARVVALGTALQDEHQLAALSRVVRR